jgi:hypothetical protein
MPSWPLGTGLKGWRGEPSKRSGGSPDAAALGLGAALGRRGALENSC